MSVTDDGAPPLLDDGDVYDIDGDYDVDGEEFDNADEMDAPPPLVDADIIELFPNDEPDVDDPDLTGELPGVPLTDEHRTYLIEQGISAAYLDLDFVQATIRSATDEEHLPPKRRFAVAKGQPFTGIWFGYDNGQGSVQWQFRPDFPRGSKKYLSREKGGSPCGVMSKPLSELGEHVYVLIIEGTKQSRAVAAALAHDPSYVVIGMSGCDGWLRSNNLQPAIERAVSGAESVVVIPDADAATNPNVYRAMKALGEVLRERFSGKRGRVKFVRTPGEGTDGIDDTLAGIPELERAGYIKGLIKTAQRTPSDKPPRNNAGDGDEVVDGKFYNPFGGGLQPVNCAEAIVESQRMLLDRTTDSYLTWNPESGLYERDGAGDKKGSAIITAGALDILGNRFRSAFVNDIEPAVRRLLLRNGMTIDDAFGDTGGLVPFKNGLFDPETRELKPYSPDIRATFRLNVDYDPDAECPTFEAWARENTAFEDGTDQLDILLDCVSALLDSVTGKCPTKIGMFFGEPRSGKGTFVNTILSSLVSAQYRTSAGLVELSRNRRFENATLYGALLSITGELPEHHIKDLVVFKLATGGDPIPAEYKFGKLFHFYNRAFLVMAGNNPPNITDTTGAALARIEPVYFTVSHVGREDLMGIDQRVLTGDLGS